MEYRMLSKYNGRCTECSYNFSKNTKIIYNATSKEAKHEYCPKQALILPTGSGGYFKKVENTTDTKCGKCRLLIQAHSYVMRDVNNVDYHLKCAVIYHGRYVN